MTAGRRARPTRRGAGLGLVGLLLAVGALASGTVTLLPLVVGVAVLLASAPVLARRRLRSLSAGFGLHLRTSPAMVAQGEPCRLIVTAGGGGHPLPPLSLESPEGRWGPAEDLSAVVGPPTAGEGPGAPPEDIGWWAPGGRHRVDLPAASAGVAAGRASARTTVDLPVPTDRRGILALPRLRLWTTDPLGLVAVPGPLQPPASVVVFPPPTATSADLAAPVEGPATGEGSVTGAPSRLRPEDARGELAGLRPYRPGDRLRLLHWPSMAGPGPMLVRELAPDHDQVVRVVVDDRVGAHRRHDFDAALSATFALVAEANSGGLPVDLVTLTGYRNRIPPTEAGMAGLFPLLATLNPRREGDRPLPVGLGWQPMAADTPLSGCTVITTGTGAPTLPTVYLHATRIVTV